MTHPKSYAAAESLAMRLLSRRMHNYIWTHKRLARQRKAEVKTAGPVVRLQGLTNLHKLIV